MFKKIMIFLVLVLFVAGCIDNSDNQQTTNEPTNTNQDTQKLTDDIDTINTIDTDIGSNDLDNVDIDTDLF
ncbi:MAG: hypothetical protein KAS12_00745 [Candidatus Aenigmarchaeota archaeon]|nr:hypothetical protein [Candidatus Aenigmarchaeota archaeon]